MITYKTGNLLDAPVEALVNTVNTVGVMGKGVAIQFKNAFPDNFKVYLDAVRSGSFHLGKVLIVPVNPIGSVKYVVNFPTKGHWRYPSKLEWISSGLQDLKAQIREKNIKSIALPPLGCGNGGLDWVQVRLLIEKEMEDLDMDVLIFEPNANIQELLKKKENPSAASLTPARAMLLQLLYNYRALGEFTSEFAAEKLSYFLQRFGERQMKLEFQKGFYGPYSGQVRHILYEVNGYYLKGYEQKDARPFEPLELMVDKAPAIQQFIMNELSVEERNRLSKVAELITGFESPYGLELLATIDYLIKENNTFDAKIITEQLWSERKRKMFSNEHIDMAISHLLAYRKDLYPSTAEITN
jgi:O-acetyl-ADP-ribose deacetylase (regulator of RNase III)